MKCSWRWPSRLRNALRAFVGKSEPLSPTRADPSLRATAERRKVYPTARQKLAIVNALASTPPMPKPTPLFLRLDTESELKDPLSIQPHLPVEHAPSSPSTPESPESSTMRNTETQPLSSSSDRSESRSIRGETSDPSPMVQEVSEAGGAPRSPRTDHGPFCLQDHSTLPWEEGLLSDFTPGPRKR